MTDQNKAAPAPSSLAGGEVTNDDAPTYMRLAQSLSRHPEVMVVERSDPTLELTPDSLEHLLEDVFPLAALSPEAPAREEVEDETYEIGKRDGYEQAVQDIDLMTGGDGEFFVSTAGNDCPDVATMKSRISERFAALTPRHEAPAPTCQKCGGEVQGWNCQGCGASFRENDDGVLIFDDEAPAEGAGDCDEPLTFTPFRDELREAQAALEPFAFIAERRGLSPATTVHLVHLDGTHIETIEVNSFWRARHSHSAIRARSSAPEASS